MADGPPDFHAPPGREALGTMRPSTRSTTLTAPRPAACDPGERARPELRRSCPSIDISGRCQVAVKSQTTREIDKLGPGQLIGVGGPGPEWFIKTDGTLITVNGLAAGRGDNAKTYDGTYNKDGMCDWRRRARCE